MALCEVNVSYQQLEATRYAGTHNMMARLAPCATERNLMHRSPTFVTVNPSLNFGASRGVLMKVEYTRSNGWDISGRS